MSPISESSVPQSGCNVLPICKRKQMSHWVSLLGPVSGKRTVMLYQRVSGRNSHGFRACPFDYFVAAVRGAHGQHILKEHIQKIMILEQKAHSLQIYHRCWRCQKILFSTRMAKCKIHTRIFTWLQAMEFLCHGKPRDRWAQGIETGVLWVSTIPCSRVSLHTV